MLAVYENVDVNGVFVVSTVIISIQLAVQKCVTGADPGRVDWVASHPLSGVI